MNDKVAQAVAAIEEAEEVAKELESLVYDLLAEVSGEAQVARSVHATEEMSNALDGIRRTLGDAIKGNREEVTAKNEALKAVLNFFNPTKDGDSWRFAVELPAEDRAAAVKLYNQVYYALGSRSEQSGTTD